LIEDLAVVEKNLTISEHLNKQKIAEFLIREWRRPGNSAPSSDPSFSGVFRSLLTEGESAGLTAQDYLSNPVDARLSPVARSSHNRDKLSVAKTPRSVKEKDSVHAEKTPKNEQKEMKSSGGDAVSKEIEQSVQNAAEKYSLPPELIRGVIQAESDFQADAVSSAGARGLMQLMPATANDLGVEDPFDIDQNIDGGSRYLRSMLDRFGNDLNKALAAYNAGPGTVERYNGRVPYQETRQYVKRVLEYSRLTA
jgi:hypothetical protein